MENNMKVSQNTRNGIIYNLAIPFLGIYPKKKKNAFTEKMYKSVQSITIHNMHKLEMT